MAIEFSRLVTFGQYIDAHSPLHRLDPRAKIVAAGLLILALLVTNTFSSFGVLFIGLALLHSLSRVPLSYVLRGMRLLFYTLVIIYIFQVLFYQSPTAEASTVWRWWLLSLSGEGLLQSLLIIIRVILLYYVTSMLMFITGMIDLANGMESLLSPLKRLRVPVNELVMVFVIALKFVPILISELERIVKARAARGQQLNSGSLVQRARKLGQVLLPIFVNAFQRADTLALAMDARCYRGGRGRTTRRVLRMRRADWLGLALIVVLVVLTFAAGRLVGV